MDYMKDYEFDDMALRLSRFIRIDKDDTIESIAKKLRDFLSKDHIGRNLTAPIAWKKMLEEVVPRVHQIDDVKKRIYERRGGDADNLKRDQLRTSKNLVDTPEDTTSRFPSHQDIDGVDTEHGKFVKER